MIPGCEPCESCGGNGTYGVHAARCWKCEGTGIQLCQWCQRHAAEYTVKSTEHMPQGDPGRVRFACGICVIHAKPFATMIEAPGFPDDKTRAAQVDAMDRTTGLILHRKRELEDNEWQREGGLDQEEEEELERLKSEYPLPNYKGFVQDLAKLYCKGGLQQPYPCEDLPGYDKSLWCISCRARDLLKQEEAVTV